MVRELKQDFKTYIQEQTKLAVEDNGVYRDSFPYLMLRIDNMTAKPAQDIMMSDISLILDIFSTFTGEKEILDITEIINKNLLTFINAHESIQFGYLRRMQILDDNSTGPVRKHGVAIFTFRLTGGYEDA